MGKHRYLDKNSDFDSVGLGWTQDFAFSNQFPGNAIVAGPWTILLHARKYNRSGCWERRE